MRGNLFDDSLMLLWCVSDLLGFKFLTWKNLAHCAEEVGCGLFSFNKFSHLFRSSACGIMLLHAQMYWQLSGKSIDYLRCKNDTVARQESQRHSAYSGSYSASGINTCSNRGWSPAQPLVAFPCCAATLVPFTTGKLFLIIWFMRLPPH